MKTLIDTNILVIAHDKDSLFQPAASRLLKDAIRGRFQAVISLQNVAEMYSVLTSTRKTRRSLKVIEVSRLCKLYLDSPQIEKLIPDENAYSRGLELASEQNFVGGDFFLIA
jgi:predicted nucleic acid-binding protein